MCGSAACSDRAALQRALDRIVERHEVLRTRFVMVDEAPTQQIVPAEQSRFTLLDHDLRGVRRGQRTLSGSSPRKRRAPFDLAQGPLIRGRLMRLADDEHVLLLTMHHIASDGWSMGVLRRRAARALRRVRDGEADPLPPLPVQYADYARVAADVAGRRGAGSGCRSTGRTTLRGAPALLPLPTDHPRPAEQQYAGGWVPLTLDAALTAALRALSRRHGTTLYMTLLAAWAVLLARLSGESDVVIGTPVANRRQHGDGRADRLLREHAAAAHRCVGRADVGDAAGAGEGADAGGAAAPGPAVRAGGGGAQPGAQPGRTARCSR